MQYTAEAKNLKISPRKMRLVVDGVKDMPIVTALATLSVASQRSSGPIKKAIESAMANAVNNGKVSKEDLYIMSLYVNEGIVYKRYHYAGRGRMRPYKKRSSHLSVVLGVREAKALPAPVAKNATKEKPMKEAKTKKEEAK